MFSEHNQIQMKFNSVFNDILQSDYRYINLGSIVHFSFLHYLIILS